MVVQSGEGQTNAELGRGFGRHITTNRYCNFADAIGMHWLCVIEAACTKLQCIAANERGRSSINVTPGPWVSLSVMNFGPSPLTLTPKR